MIGKAVNGHQEYSFAVPVLHSPDGCLYLDTILLDSGLISVLLFLSRAYFLADMEAPSAYVQFLRSIMPSKPRSELYTVLGLGKQGKTMFFRDLIHHLLDPAQRTGREDLIEQGVKEYGDAIRELAIANIFPGDMLWKNFGVTRYGRVVFYDYDEIEHMTDCNFRRIPPAPYPELELSGEVWHPVGHNDIFPEEFATFLLTSPGGHDVFMKYHADLLDVDFWKKAQADIREGQIRDFFPYPEQLRFCHLFFHVAQGG